MKSYANTGFLVSLYNFGTRTLDPLHIAAAILVEAAQFLSFDERQRHAAKRERLKLRPA
jgi:predicted nucleic acid-binding protein